MAETQVDRGSLVVPPPKGKYPRGFDPRKAPADRGGVSILDLLGGAADAIEPAFTSPLPDSLKDLEFAREVTGVPSYFRIRRADIEGKPRDEADVYSLIPGLGAVGGFTRKAKKVAGVALDAEQLAARIGAKTPAQAAAADDLARQVAARKPGFLQTAEERIGRGTSTVAKATEETADPYRLGARLENLGIPDGAKNLIVQNAERDIAQTGAPVAFEKQRRGVVPVEVTDRKAQVLAEQLDIEDLSRTRAGTAFNAEELRAIRKATAQKATDLDVLNTSIQEVGLVNATPDQKLAALKTALELNSLQRVGAGARAEAGRALRALREVDEAIKSKTDAAYERAFQALGGRADVDAKLARLQDIWNDASRPVEARERDVYAFVRDIEKASVGKKLEEFWLNSILSNPITHEINTIGNALLLTAERLPTRLAASTVEELLTLHGTLRPKSVTYTDTLVGAVSTFTAVKKAAQKALYYAKTSASEFDVNKFREAGTVGQRQALEGSAGTILNIPTRLLGVEDAFFYTMAYEGELAAQATRKALERSSPASLKEFVVGEGFNPLSAQFARRVALLQKTSAIKDAAQKSADLITLKTPPDKATDAILTLRRNLPGARFVLPFVQTPMNLLKRGFDYSPLGFTKLFKEGLTHEDKALVTGRAVVGSGLLAYFAARAAEGEITGPAPSNAKKRELFYDQGYRPFAIKVGDAWVEWGRFEPLATPIKWALAARAAYEETGEELSAETTMAMAAAIGRALIDTTYLSGMSNFINALEDPTGAGERTISRIITGGVPFSGFLRGLAGVEDPYLRDPKELIERVEVGIPGFSRAVNPLYNILGEPVTRPPSRQGLGALVSPIVAEDREPHPVIAEDARLTDVFGKASPGKAAEYTGISRPADAVAGVKLTADQQALHEQYVGQARKERLSTLLVDPRYVGADDVKKLELWREAADAAAKVGRKQFGLQMAVDGEESGAIIAFANSPSNYDKAETLYVLREGGALTPATVLALEARSDDDLSVADFLHGKELVDAYRKAPAFIAGDPNVWAVTKRAREQYMELIRGMTADERKRNANVQNFYNTAAGGWLRTLYSSDGSRNEKYVHPTRKLIQQDKVWARFATTVSKEP